MRVIPGSFREVYEHSRDPDSNHHIRCYPPEERQHLVELPAGGALFFAYGVAHATGANHTDHERAGVAMHFLRTDFAQPELVEIGRDTRPDITGPQASGGLNEYGTVVAGTWDAEVEQALSRISGAGA
jgi:ectoine hydroxylase-related dioxygenase (phytanoyl-CoA dioxygenase family)